NRSLDLENAVFTEADKTGGLARGTPHYELHFGEGAKRLNELQSKRAAARASVPPNTQKGSVAPELLLYGFAGVGKNALFAYVSYSSLISDIRQREGILAASDASNLASSGLSILYSATRVFGMGPLDKGYPILAEGAAVTGAAAFGLYYGKRTYENSGL